jgi:hypothetical protein
VCDSGNCLCQSLSERQITWNLCETHLISTQRAVFFKMLRWGSGAVLVASQRRPSGFANSQPEWLRKFPAVETAESADRGTSEQHHPKIRG